MRNPPIEIDQVRLIGIDQLGRARQPIVQPGLRDRRPVVGHIGIVLAGQTHLRRTIQRGVTRVVDVRIECAPAVEEPVVLGAVRGQPEMQPLRANGLGQFAQQVALGPHLHRRPVGQLGVVQRKAVMVLGHRHHIARAGRAEQLGPAIRVELGRGELGNQILVAEARLRAVGGHVMGEFLGTFQIHVARIPLAAECRHREHAPVDEDAELGVVVPRRRLICLQCRPVGAERALACAGFGFAHQALAFGRIGSGGIEPLLVDDFRAERGGGRGGRRLRRMDLQRRQREH